MANMSNKHQIKRMMRKMVTAQGKEEYQDNATALAEDTAIMLDHPEWLDDPDHEVWDCAVEISEELGL